jgi:hypothetical protein
MRVLLLIFAALMASVSARAGARQKVDPHRYRSLEEIPDKHHRRLVRRSADSVELELHSFKDKGVERTFEAGHLARHLHTVLGGHEDLDDESRMLTMTALGLGLKEFTHVVLEELHPEHLRGRQLATISVVFFIAVFILAIAIVVGFVLLNLLTVGGMIPPLPFLAMDADFLKGVPAVDYEQISPCNLLPMRQTMIGSETQPPEFAYLPVTGGATGDMVDSITNVFRRRLQDVGSDSSVQAGFNLFTDNMSLQNVNNASIPTDATCLEENDPCFFNAECCRTGGYRGVDRSEALVANQTGKCIQVEKKDIDFILEPFCLMWSPDSAGGIDTLGFVALQGWPPINVDLCVAWLLPWCYMPNGGCSYCELTNGVEAQVGLKGNWKRSDRLRL